MASQTQSQRHRDEMLSHVQWGGNLGATGPISVAVTFPYCQVGWVCALHFLLLLWPSSGRVGGVLYIGRARINYLQINELGHWLLTDDSLLLLKMYFFFQSVALFSFSLWIAAYRSKKRKPQLYKPADFLIKEPVLNLFILPIPNEFKMVAS